MSTARTSIASPASWILALAGAAIGLGASPASGQPFEIAYGTSTDQFEQFSAVATSIFRPTGAVVGGGAVSVGDLPPAVGSTFDPPDWLVMRTGDDGTITWQKRIVAGDRSYTGASSVCTLSDGSAIIVGARATTFSADRISVVRMSQSGTVMWARDIATGATQFSGRGPVAVAQAGSGFAIGFNGDDGPIIYRFTDGGTLVSARQYSVPASTDTLQLNDLVDSTASVLACGAITETTNFTTRAFVARLGDGAGAFSAARFGVDEADTAYSPYTGAVAIEKIPGGDLALACQADVYPVHLPGDEVFPTTGVLLVRASSALTPVWRSLITNSNASQGLYAWYTSLRFQSGVGPDVLGLAGQFPFGDGGSFVWLARWNAGGGYLDRHEYQNTGFNSFPGGLAVATSAPGWLIAGYLSRFDGPSALLVRPDLAGATGCEQLQIDEVVERPFSWEPLTLLEVPITPVVTTWTPTVVNLAFTSESICQGGGGGCNLADITEVGGTEEFPGSPDGQLTVDDLILFVNLFSAGTGCPGTPPCNLADVTGIGGAGAPPDGELTVDDLIEFVNAFSSGC